MNIRDRVKAFRRVKASSIRPSPHNWRTHPKAQADALRGLLGELGFAGAVLARELPDGTIEAIDGHLRLETMGDRKVPVLVTDLDEAEARKLLAAFDPLGAMAGADAEKLDVLLKGVHTDNDALRAMLDGLAHDHGLAIPVAAGGGGDEFDPTPEETGPTRTAAGELWVIGGKHRLFVGDCTVPENVKRLMGGEKAGLVCTDPPYGVDFKRGQFITDPSRRSSRARGVGDDIAGDHRKGQDQHDFIRSVFLVAAGHVQPGASVYMWSATLQPGSHSMLGLSAAGVHIQNQLVWVKNNLVLGQCDYQWKHEPCWYGWYETGKHQWHGGRDKTTILEFARVQSTEHPNEKPLDMIGFLVSNSTTAGDLVYDPFLGSGTTLVAAHRLGRVCYGCELEPRYADVILRRAEAEGLECTRDEEVKPATKARNGKARKTHT